MKELKKKGRIRINKNNFNESSKNITTCFNIKISWLCNQYDMLWVHFPLWLSTWKHLIKLAINMETFELGFVHFLHIWLDKQYESFCFFCSARDRTQGLMHATSAVPLSYTVSPYMQVVKEMQTLTAQQHH